MLSDSADTKLLLCVCVLWPECADSAQPEWDRVLWDRRKREDEESGVRGLSGRVLWEGRV